MPYHIALTYNLKPEALPQGTAPDAYSEFDSAQTVSAISQALRSHGHEVEAVEATPMLLEWLRTHPIDMVFNIAEGVRGESRESQVPAILEFLGIPYTGSGVLALSLALDKAKSKQCFKAAGIATPEFQLFEDPDQTLDPRLKFPLIIKPNQEGSAKGISASSFVTNASEALEQIGRVYEQYRQPVLAEEFIDGVELTVGIIGNDPPQALPVLEIDFSTCHAPGERFYTWRMKEYQGNRDLGLTPTFWCPARLSKETAQRVQEEALKAHQALGCRDFSRVDLRLDAQKIPHVLEVNPLPGLDPAESNFPRMARAGGIEYDQLIGRLTELVGARFRRRASVTPVTGENGRPVAA